MLSYFSSILILYSAYSLKAGNDENTILDGDEDKENDDYYSNYSYAF